MKYLISILVFLSSICLNASSEYYQYSDYIKLKNQEKISQDFIELIKKDADKIKKENKIIKIVIVYPGNQLSDYWRKSKISFQKRLDELEIKYELIDFFTKPAVEIREQSKLLLNAMKDDTDYLVFTLDAKKHARFVERIVNKKKPKLILQNITTPLKKWKERQPFLYVGFDHVEGSKLLADYYINKVGKEGNYAVLHGTKGYVSFMRGTKFIEYISSKSNLKVIHEYYTNANKDNAKTATLDLLEINPDIKFIYATTTDIALGVIEALEEKNLIGKILVNGWGGGSSELKAIEEGLLDVTVMRMNDDNGVAMAEAIKLDLEGDSLLIPTIFSGEFALVEKGILKNELDILKKRAFRYTLNE